MRLLLPAALLTAVSGCAVTAQPTQLVREGLPSALEAGWNGERVCGEQYRTTTHRVLRCSFPPGVGHEPHFHPAHWGYALSGGTMRLTNADGVREAEIATGSSYSSAGEPWHHVINIGDTEVTYLIVETL